MMQLRSQGESANGRFETVSRRRSATQFATTRQPSAAPSRPSLPMQQECGKKLPGRGDARRSTPSATSRSMIESIASHNSETSTGKAHARKREMEDNDGALINKLPKAAQTPTLCENGYGACPPNPTAD